MLRSNCKVSYFLSHFPSDLLRQEEELSARDAECEAEGSPQRGKDREVWNPIGKAQSSSVTPATSACSKGERWCVMTLYHLAQLGTSHLKRVLPATAARWPRRVESGVRSV